MKTVLTGKPELAIIEDILSDGSKVYNVELYNEEHECKAVIGCNDKRHAERLFYQLDIASGIDVS